MTFTLDASARVARGTGQNEIHVPITSTSPANTDLNPYGEDNPILHLEKVNFPPDKRDDLGARPVLPYDLCQAVCSVQPASSARPQATALAI
jgi:hypothetical protein